MLKILIGILFFLALISLFSGFFFLMKDQQDSKRLLTSLKLRVGLCIAIVVMIAYGFWSGELVSTSPWGQIHN